MGKVGFADLKLKLIGAIVAISAVELLKAFLISQNYTDNQLAWKVGIHFTFVLSGVFFAVTDYIADSSKRKQGARARRAGAAVDYDRGAAANKGRS